MTYKFSTPEEITKHMNQKYLSGNIGTLFIELPDKYNTVDIPEEILTIPFIGTMMGIAMFYHTTIAVNTVEASYYNSLEKIEAVFRKMYPKADMSLLVSYREMRNTHFDTDVSKTSLFFTGGVDATSAFIDVVDENPLLINIEGGDISLNNTTAHKELDDYFKTLTKSFASISYCFIKSNCREIFMEYSFDRIFRRVVTREGWWGYWASIAHIIVMTATIAPVLYAEKISVHYIGSSHATKESAFDGNNEELIRVISFCGCKFISADANLERNEKVKKIVSYCKENKMFFSLQVCWNKTEGKNCSSCEKCYRTILNIVSSYGDPNDYGFIVDQDTYKKIKRYLQTTPVKLSY